MVSLLNDAAGILPETWEHCQRCGAVGGRHTTGCGPRQPAATGGVRGRHHADEPLWTHLPGLQIIRQLCRYTPAWLSPALSLVASVSMS